MLLVNNEYRYIYVKNSSPVLYFLKVKDYLKTVFVTARVIFISRLLTCSKLKDENKNLYVT